MGDVTSTIMIWSFVAGLAVAFAGAFIAHLLVSYRQTSEQFQELVAVLSQIAELNQDELEDAARAAQEASENDVLNIEVDHVGAYVWRLQKRLHETLEPVYPHVGGDIKEDIHQIDTRIYRLNDGLWVQI